MKRLSALLLLIVALPYWASAQSMPGMAAQAAASQAPADQAMMAGMTAMQQAMARAPMTGDADHDFVAMMIPHHQGAIDMAETELRFGKDPALRAMARSIVRAQQREISQMKAWQRSHR